MNVLISIIIPVYNTENYLETCLNSLVNQTLKDIEIITINDGSTDNSLEILKKYAEKDERIKVIDKKNEGQSIARNIGLKYASGEFIAFVDSDDYIDLDAYERLYEFIKNTDNDMVICNAIRFNSEKEYRAKLHRKSIPKKCIAFTNIFERKSLIYDTGIWNKLIKKSFWDENNFSYEPGRLYEDLLLATELHCAAKSIGILPEIKYHWRLREEGANKSTTQNTGKIKNLKDRIFIIERLSELYKSQKKYNVLLLPHYKKCIGYDIPIFMNKFDISDEKYKKEFMSLIGPLLNEIPLEVLKNEGILSKLKYQAVIENNINILDSLVKYSKKHSKNKKIMKLLLIMKDVTLNGALFYVFRLYKRKKF